MTRPVYAARAALIDLPHTATPEEILAAVVDALAPHATLTVPADIAGRAVIAQVVSRINGGRDMLGQLSGDAIATVMRAIAGEHPIEGVVPDELPDGDVVWLAKVAAAAGFESHRPEAARWVIAKVVGGWRAVAQDTAAVGVADRAVADV